MKYLDHEIHTMFNIETTAIISKLAKEYSIETAALLAIVETESAGVSFWKVGSFDKPAIRFEGHYFYDRIPESRRAEAVKLGLAHPDAGVVKNPKSYAARYALLERARAFDENAALESTSWGLGQVMGANWRDLGYKSVKDFVSKQNTIEGQVEAMLRFIKVNGLIKYINAKNWKAFASRYNGPAYKKNKYDTKMADAYSRYSTGTVAQSDAGVIHFMQNMLNAVGEYKLKVDGVMGPQTKTALMDFQLKNGLVADGIYGPLTREELEKDYVDAANKREDILGKIGTIGGASGTAISEAAKQIEPLAATSVWLQYLFIGLTVIGILVTLKATIWK